MGACSPYVSYWVPVATQCRVPAPEPDIPAVIPVSVTLFAYATFVGADGPTKEATTEYTAPNDLGNVTAILAPADIGSCPHCISSPFGRLAKPAGLCLKLD